MWNAVCEYWLIKCKLSFTTQSQCLQLLAGLNICPHPSLLSHTNHMGVWTQIHRPWLSWGLCHGNWGAKIPFLASDPLRGRCMVLLSQSGDLVLLANWRAANRRRSYRVLSQAQHEERRLHPLTNWSTIPRLKWFASIKESLLSLCMWNEKGPAAWS